MKKSRKDLHELKGGADKALIWKQIRATDRIA